MRRLAGRVKWYDVKKGFGFITPDDGGSDLFVHYSDIEQEADRELVQSDRVEYEAGETPYGPHALRVRRLAAEDQAAG